MCKLGVNRYHTLGCGKVRWLKANLILLEHTPPHLLTSRTLLIGFLLNHTLPAYKGEVE